jgi:dTDP-4-dehydrorhamnose 3,5-epimerase
MRCEPTSLPGVLIVEPTVYRDARGYFLETWSRDRYAALGLPAEFVQDNVSFSLRGVLRGLHYQHPDGQGKLVGALQGCVYDVAVDLRRGSRTFGRWVGATLSVENGRQMYIPPGYAHGFLVQSESALIAYKCTEPYQPAQEGSVLWNDPDLAIAWPRESSDPPVLSDRDRNAPRLADIAEDRLPRYESGVVA